MKKNSIENSKQFFSSLQNSTPEGVFLFLGEEEYEKEKAVDALAARFFADEKKIYTFHCESGELMSAAETVLSSDMFSPQKLCVVKGINAALKKKADTHIVEDMIKNRPAETLLILEATANKAPAALKNLSSLIRPVVFWKKFENELSAYIVSELARHKKKILPEAASYLLSLTGRDLAKIDDSLKNIIYGSKGETISAEEVAYLISDSKEVTVFECLDALFQKKRNSLTLIDRLISSGTHELVLVSMIMSRLNQLEKYNFLTQNRIQPDEALSRAGVYPKQKAVFQQSVRLFRPVDIKDAILTCTKVEKQLKSMAVGKNILANPVTDLAYTILK